MRSADTLTVRERGRVVESRSVEIITPEWLGTSSAWRGGRVSARVTTSLALSLSK